MARKKRLEQPENPPTSIEQADGPREGTLQSSTASKTLQNALVKFTASSYLSRLVANIHLRLDSKRVHIALGLVVAGLLLALLVPVSRYTILGLVLNQSVNVELADSSTSQAITEATVRIDNQTATTDTTGRATIKHVHLGLKRLEITKAYYKSYSVSLLVGGQEADQFEQFHLVATGRPTSILVLNTIGGAPIAGALVSAQGSKARTDKNGAATLILPIGTSTTSISISKEGFNNSSGTLTASTSITERTRSYNLTPSGKIYFLSNQSGKIDVAKANLDGTDRQTVIAGTGYESSNTVLLASQDWKYLALYAQRKADSGPEIDLIDTSNDTLSNIDEGNATFTLVGWAGDNLIYRVDRNGYQLWQSGRQVLKSFDAASGTLTVLAQTTAAGSSFYDYIGQDFSGVFIFGDKILYSLYWDTIGNEWQLSNKQATITSVNADGSSSKLIKEFSLEFDNRYGGATNFSIDVRPFDKPNSLVIKLSVFLSYAYDGVGGTKTQYYEYNDGTMMVAPDMTDTIFYSGNYPAYLLSPSGHQTFWANYADGKNSLFVGDQNGGAAKAIINTDNYAAYGWFTDNYLLASKDSSELYIMDADGTGQPLKVTDYYKPPAFYRY